MRLSERARKAVRQVLLGADTFPQQCIVGMREPQSEIAVELHGAGATLDVTESHMLACAAPFTIAIGMTPGLKQQVAAARRLSLQLSERGGTRRLLGKLELRLGFVYSVGSRAVCCFSVAGCTNRCVPRVRLWGNYLHWAYVRWRRPPDVRITARDGRAMAVFFICPRPVVLVSAGGNIFPMNLMGDLGGGVFGFALNRTRTAASVVKHAGRIAISTVPVEQAATARALGGNHWRESIDWSALPFATEPSAAFGIRVPSFAVNVREIEISEAHDLGSHTFFIARIVHDQKRATSDQFFMIHGLYQAWRHKHLRLHAAASECAM